MTRQPTLVWTDGSCNAKGIRGRGGWAALIEDGEAVREISGGVDGTTHNRMELTAICEALEMLSGAIEIRTDRRTSRNASTTTGTSGGCVTALGGDRTGDGSRTKTCGSVCLLWCGTTHET